jgi:hypothetical protein
VARRALLERVATEEERVLHDVLDPQLGPDESAALRAVLARVYAVVLACYEERRAGRRAGQTAGGVKGNSPFESICPGVAARRRAGAAAEGPRRARRESAGQWQMGVRPVALRLG